MTFASGICPKTINCTAGCTPYPSFARPAKRKLEFSSTGKTVQNVAKKKLISATEAGLINLLFYYIGPDGVAAFFAARGHPDGPPGYIAPAIHAMNEAFTTEHSRWRAMATRLNAQWVLPLQDSHTGQARKLHFAGGTKSMDVKAVVYIFDTVQECGENACNNICTNLIAEFNNQFDVSRLVVM